AERIFVGKMRDRHVLPQAEINALLVRLARAGKRVLRLKGGDPFIFGRGGEEARALADAGIPFEIVPGITAATAASEYAGISLTHRESASAVAFVTGHEDPAKDDTSLDYGLLAKFPGTVVFYMGLHRLRAIVESLIAAGRSPDVPACVISRATTPMQKTVAAPLAELPQAVRSARLHAPSLIIVGEVVRQRETIAWFESKPLFGRRIGITRPEGQADAAIAQALALGAEPVLLPTIRILPPDDWSKVDAALARLHEFDWLIFTSANGVESLLGRLWETGGDVRRLGNVKLAAIGPATAEALERFHLKADLVPGTFRAEALAHTLKPHVAGRRVLWARASRGRDVLPSELEAAGTTVEQLVVYQNIDVESLSPSVHEMIRDGELDWIGLSSPSIARSLHRLLDDSAKGPLGRTTRLASISPVTTAAAVEAGLPISAEATEYTWDGIFEAILRAEALP
ncbi:MAG: uroporphyrinogen-III C-methyltransferase, partial [Planctomycetaceae bacterium]